MADKKEILPDMDPEEAMEFAKNFHDYMEKSSDMAKGMATYFKYINGIGKDAIKDADKAKSLQKAFLNGKNGANKADMIRRQLSEDIVKAESEINDLQLAQIDDSAYKLSLNERNAEVYSQIQSLENNQRDIEEEINKALSSREAFIEMVNDALENSDKIESQILKRKKEEEVISTRIKKMQEEVTANEGVLNSLQAQRLKMIEEKEQMNKDGLNGSEKYLKLLNEEWEIQKKIKPLSDAVVDKTREEAKLKTMTIARLVLEKQSEKYQKRLSELAEDIKNTDEEILSAGLLYEDVEQKITKSKKEQVRLLDALDDPKKAIDARLAELNIQIDQNKQARGLLANQRGLLNSLMDIATAQGGMIGKTVSISKKAIEVSKNFKGVIGPILLLTVLLKEGLDLFIKLDKAAEKFRESTGFSNTQMKELRRDAEQVNREFQHFGVGIDESYKAAKALTDIFGKTSLVTKETMGNVALLAANLGVTETDSANVLANFTGLGGATQETAMNLIKVGAGLSEKIGVPFKMVMQDIANASEQTTTLIGSNPSKLLKAAIAARAMGTELNKISGSQRKLLDYSSSITDELEASALLGKSLSFQRARQLAYEGDIEGSAKATLDTIKKAGDFNKMNVYQREALAKASGMELKDITKMLAVEKQRDDIMLRGTDEQRAKLKAQEDELAAMKEKADLDDADLIKQNEKVLMQQKMQGLVTQFKNIWDSIVLQLGSVLEPIIRDLAEGILLFVKAITPIASVILPLISGGFKIVFAVVSGILSPLKEIFDTLQETMGGAEGVAGYMNDFGKALDENVLPAFKFLGKIIGYAIISPFKFIMDMVGTFVGLMYSVVSGELAVGDSILIGIKAVAKPIYNTFIKPFADVYNWVMKFLGGHSPSKIGLAIVDGIKSVGSMLLDGLTYPFRTAMNFISDIFGGDGQLGTMIVDGIKKAASFIFDIVTTPFKKAFEFVRESFDKLFKGNNIQKQVSVVQEVSTVSNIVEVNHLDDLRDVVQDLVESIATINTSTPLESVTGGKIDTSALESKLDNLTNLLVGGAVRVYLDGKDVSAAMTGIGR